MVHIEDTQAMNIAVSPYLCSLPPPPHHRSPSDLQMAVSLRPIYPPGHPPPPPRLHGGLAVISEYDHPRV